MKKLIMLFVLSLNIALVYSQDKVRFDGNFSTCLSTAGEADYYYYRENGDKLKDGSFRYKLRQEKAYGRIQQRVKGYFEKGEYDRSWAINTSLRDYEYQDKYCTGKVNLRIPFNDNTPNGSCGFSMNLKYRELESVNNGRARWGEYERFINQTSKFSFYEGVLVDTFEVKTNKYRIFGILDMEGTLMGQWFYSDSENSIVKTYRKGFLVNKIIKNQEGKIIKQKSYETDYEKYKTYINLKGEDSVKDLKYSIKKFSLLNEKKSAYYQFFNGAIIKNDFFCLNDFFDNYDLNSQTDGLFYYKIINKVSEEEKIKIKKIKRIAGEISSINNDVNNYVKGEIIFDEVESILKFLKFYDGLGEKFVCMAEEYVKYSDIETSRKRAHENCRGRFTLVNPLPEFKEREDALDYFVRDLNEKHKKAKPYMKKIKTKLIVK